MLFILTRGSRQFLMRYYIPGDDIYFFGFSRGAYTARFLAEMLDHIGIYTFRLLFFPNHDKSSHITILYGLVTSLQSFLVLPSTCAFLFRDAVLLLNAPPLFILLHIPRKIATEY